MYRVTVKNRSTFDVHTSKEAKAAVEAITREGMAANFANLRIAKVRPVSEKRLAWARAVIAKSEAQQAAVAAASTKKASSRPVARPVATSASA